MADSVPAALRRYSELLMPTFANVQTVIKSAASLVAVIPGLALILAAIELPVSLQQMLGGLSLAMGILVVLATYLFGKDIHRFPARQIGVVVVVIFVLGAATAVFAQRFARDHLVVFQKPDAPNELLMKPVRASGKLAIYTRRFQGDYVEALHHPIFGSEVRAEMNRQSGSAVWIMSSTILLAEFLILTALLVAAWKVADTLERRKPGSGGRRQSDQAEAAT